MVDNSMIPRAFGVTTARRAREDAARLAERRDGARRSATTQQPPGGTYKVNGDFTVAGGGRLLVQDGGGAEITGGGTLAVSGSFFNDTTSDIETSKVTIANRPVLNSIFGSYLSPGIYFDGDLESNVSDTPRIAAIDSNSGVGLKSAQRVPFGSPETIKDFSAVSVSDIARIASTRFDTTKNPYDEVTVFESLGEWRAGPESIAGTVTDVASYDLGYVASKAGGAKMVATQYAPFSTASAGVGLGGIIDISADNGVGKKASIKHAGDGKLELAADVAVNVTGTFTVNGAPVSGGGGGPLLIYRRNALLSLASGYLGNVPWDAVSEDAALYGADPGRMYVTVPGVYQVSAFITITDANKTGNRQVVVKKNGTNYTGIAGNPITGANYAGSFATPIRMAAGDFLEIVAYQNSGAAASLTASPGAQSYNNASMQWLRS